MSLIPPALTTADVTARIHRFSPPLHCALCRSTLCARVFVVAHATRARIGGFVFESREVWPSEGSRDRRGSSTRQQKPREKKGRWKLVCAASCPREHGPDRRRTPLSSCYHGGAAAVLRGGLHPESPPGRQPAERARPADHAEGGGKLPAGAQLLQVCSEGHRSQHEEDSGHLDVRGISSVRLSCQLFWPEPQVTPKFGAPRSRRLVSSRGLLLAWGLASLRLRPRASDHPPTSFPVSSFPFQLMFRSNGTFSAKRSRCTRMQPGACQFLITRHLCCGVCGASGSDLNDVILTEITGNGPVKRGLGHEKRIKFEAGSKAGVCSASGGAATATNFTPKNADSFENPKRRRTGSVGSDTQKPFKHLHQLSVQKSLG